MDSHNDATGILDGAGCHLFAQIALAVIAAVATTVYLFRNQSNEEEFKNKVHVQALPHTKPVNMPMPSNVRVLSPVDGCLSAAPARENARSEYRAIVDHDEYKDVICGDDDVIIPDVPLYSKPPKVKHTSQWSASLESITEEEEDGERARDRRHSEDSSSSEAYAAYISSVNESPKIYHAGRVWCITKSQQEIRKDGYLETNIDDINDGLSYNSFGYEKYKYKHIISKKENGMDEQDAISAATPTPTYVLQGTAVPAVYPGHCQYLANIKNEQSVDRPNFVTTERGNAEWSYSFPIATDSFAAAVDHEEPCEGTVSYTNIRQPVASIISENSPLVDQSAQRSDDWITIPMKSTHGVSDVEHAEATLTHDLEKRDINEITDNENETKPSDIDVNKSEENVSWLETFTSTLIIPTLNLSPTIHREDIPIESEIGETENITITLSENPEDAQENPKGREETNIDIPILQARWDMNNEKENGTNDSKTNGPKGAKLTDKFHSSDTKHKHNGEKTKQNKVNKSKLIDDAKIQITQEQHDEGNDIEIEDDDDLQTINESDGATEGTELNMDDLTVEVTTIIVSETEDDSPRIDEINDGPVIEHNNIGPVKTEQCSVRLLCCQVPRLISSSSDPYLVNTDAQVQRRQSTDTDLTELVGSCEGDDHVVLSEEHYIKDGTEMEPKQFTIDTKINQTESVVQETKELSDKTNIEFRSSVRLTAPESVESTVTQDNIDQIPNKSITSYEPEVENDNPETSLYTYNGKSIEPKGYAAKNAHAFYLVGTSNEDNDLTKSKTLMADQATCSGGVGMWNKHRKNDQEKQNLTPLSIINKVIPSLTHSVRALENNMEQDSVELDTKQNPKLANYDGEIQTVGTRCDSLEVVHNTAQEEGDRIQKLLKEWRTEVTIGADDTQTEFKISKQEEQTVRQSSADLTNATVGRIAATEQTDTKVTLTPKSEPWENDSTLSTTSEASERASIVIAAQRKRVRESLKTLNLPNWYTKSKHHKKTINDELVIDYPDYASESRFDRSHSRSSCGGSDWSVESAETGSSCGAATKLSFHSEARYRRAYHNYDRYYNSFSSTQIPIRTAFSCAELPRGDTLYSEQTNLQNRLDLELSGKYHSSDALLSMNESPVMSVETQQTPLESSPHHISSPNLSPGRTRSSSTGEYDNEDLNFSALSIRRLEHQTSDAIFFITGQLDSPTNAISAPELVSPGDDSGFNDSFEPSREYEMKEDHIRQLESATIKQISSEDMVFYDVQSNSIVDPKQNIPISKPPMKPPRLLVSHYTHLDGMKDTTKPNTYQFVPISLAEEEEWPPDQNGSPKYKDKLSSRSEDNLCRTPTIRPDPRYKPDISRNDKVSPFPTLTQSSEELSSSREGSPRRKRCNVRITITDTSLGSESIPHLSGYTSGDLENVPIQRPKTPINFNELKESSFAAVLSVITPRSSTETPSDSIRPPPEISMEEIVDSLLGLSSSKADLLEIEAGKNCSSFSSPPELNWSKISEQQASNTYEHSASIDSLLTDDGWSPLNSIIIKNDDKVDDTSGSSKDSTSRSVQDVVDDDTVMVKCSYRKCAKIKELDEARKTYRTCHNCYTYYCSRECRLAHWEIHKKTCLFGRINSAAKHVIYNSRYNQELQSDLSKIARTGYLSRGRGAILLIFPDAVSAESYMTYGVDGLTYPPTYSTIRDLGNSGLFEDHLQFLIEMCRTYNPDIKFVLNVAIMASNESSNPVPRKREKNVKKCAKLRLSMLHTQPRQTPSDERETLILTAPSGVFSEGGLDKKSRQICFIHIQRQLRQKGVSLRHQHSEIYDQLCRWVEYHENFTPVTIYPREGGTGRRFMCVIMPDSYPNDFGWAHNPQLLDSIDLDAELEKLENVVSNVTTKDHLSPALN